MSGDSHPTALIFSIQPGWMPAPECGPGMEATAAFRLQRSARLTGGHGSGQEGAPTSTDWGSLTAPCVSPSCPLPGCCEAQGKPSGDASGLVTSAWQNVLNERSCPPRSFRALAPWSDMGCEEHSVIEEWGYGSGRRGPSRSRPCPVAEMGSKPSRPEFRAQDMSSLWGCQWGHPRPRKGTAMLMPPPQGRLESGSFILRPC